MSDDDDKAAAAAADSLQDIIEQMGEQALQQESLLLHTTDDSYEDKTTTSRTDSSSNTTVAAMMMEDAVLWPSAMDMETARELDEAVVLLSPATVAETPQTVDIVSSSNTTTTYTTSTTTSSTSNPLDTMMDRDRCHLSVAIAACVTTVEQWQQWVTTCRGSDAGLLHAILYPPTSTRACQQVRNMCVLDPDVAAIVTDVVLRANTAWDGLLLDTWRDWLMGTAEDTMTATARQRRHLYVLQVLLELCMASDDAVAAIRAHTGLTEAIRRRSSYWNTSPAVTNKSRKRIRLLSSLRGWFGKQKRRRPYSYRPRRFREAARQAQALQGEVERHANQLLAALGRTTWVPKSPHQKGLRVLSLDGGGSRGMVAVKAMKCLMDAVGGGADVADSFDLIVGTSTGGIIAFLVGLQQESSAQAVKRYEQLISKIFIKSALSTPLMLFTTASYDESHFMKVLMEILKDDTMLDSRADPAVPYVCALASKMSSTPTHVALFRNYNYEDNERADPFTIDPDDARERLDLPLALEQNHIRKSRYPRKQRGSIMPGSEKEGPGSRHPGSFRVLQRYALRASTAAPTVFKPVLMGGEMYCDGGIIASNPSAVALHEARALFPDVPIELLVSVGTGAFVEQKSPARVGWDGIISQIVNSATESEQIHHALDDILGAPAVLHDNLGANALSQTRYFRFNPTLGPSDQFPIDETNPDKLWELQDITERYMTEPAQQAKTRRVAEILRGRERHHRRLFPWRRRTKRQP